MPEDQSKKDAEKLRSHLASRYFDTHRGRVDIMIPYFTLRSQLQPRVNRSSSLPAGPQEALQSRLKEALEKETKVTRP